MEALWDNTPGSVHSPQLPCIPRQAADPPPEVGNGLLRRVGGCRVVIPAREKGEQSTDPHPSHTIAAHRALVSN